MATIDSLTLKATPLTTDTIELNDGKKATLASLPVTTAQTADTVAKVAAEAALRVSGDAASVSTAASDATTKANAAQAAAISAAATDATVKVLVETTRALAVEADLSDSIQLEGSARVSADNVLAASVTAAQAFAIQRANHTGTQLAATISDFSTAADARIGAQKGAASGIAALDASSNLTVPGGTIYSSSSGMRLGFTGAGQTGTPSKAGIQMYANGMHRLTADGGDSVMEIVNRDFGPNGVSALSFGYPIPTGSLYVGKMAIGVWAPGDVWEPTNPFGFIETGKIVEDVPMNFYVVNTNNHGAPDWHYPQMGFMSDGKIMMNRVTDTSLVNHAFHMKPSGEFELQAGSNVPVLTLLQSNSRTAGWGLFPSTTGSFGIGRYASGAYSDYALTFDAPGNATFLSGTTTTIPLAVIASGTAALRATTDVAALTMHQANSGSAGWTIGAFNSGGLVFSRIGGVDALSFTLAGVASFIASVGIDGLTRIGATGGTSLVHAINGSVATTVGAAGAGAALPATPAGYLRVTVNGTTQKLPYYTD